LSEARAAVSHTLRIFLLSGAEEGHGYELKEDCTKIN